MFKRLVLDDWQQTIPYITFGLTFVIFVIVVVRAIRMKKAKADRLANLPLEKDSKPTDQKNRHGRH